MTPYIGYSSVLKIWVDLFHTNPYRKDNIQAIFTLKVGNIYQIQSTNFCFILVVIDNDTVIYCGNYNQFDCCILSKAQADHLLTLYKSRDIDAIFSLYGISVGNDCIEYTKIYPIDRIPNLDALVEVCFFSEDPRAEDSKDERITFTNNRDEDYNVLLRQYYYEWITNFNTLTRKVDSYYSRDY
jgi:hypothetical protein